MLIILYIMNRFRQQSTEATINWPLLAATAIVSALWLMAASTLCAQSPAMNPTAGGAKPANTIQQVAAQETAQFPARPVRRQVMNPGMLPHSSAPGYVYAEPRRSIRDFSWIYIEEPELEEIKQHDIITILVDKKYQDRVNSNFNRQRNLSFKAELKEFLRLDDDGNLANAADNQPTIDTNLQGNLTSNGGISNQEGIQYRIAAIVVEVLPNGNLVLEARDRIEINGDVFVYTLTGILPSDKVAANMTATSENIYNLDVAKEMKGKVGDAVKRPWGMYLYDKLSPF